MNGRKTCGFYIRLHGKCWYFLAERVGGLDDFLRIFRETRKEREEPVLTVARRLPGTEEISEKAWMEISDDLEAQGRFSCFMVLDLDTDTLWFNQVLDDGLAYYRFPLTEVLGAENVFGELWDWLLSRYPKARMS